MSSKLPIEMIEMLEFFIIIYCAGNVIFQVFIIELDVGTVVKNYPIPFIGLVIGLLHAALPMQLLNEKFFKVQDNPPNIEEWKTAQFKFFTSYERENPATSLFAKTHHIQTLKTGKSQLLLAH